MKVDGNQLLKNWTKNQGNNQREIRFDTNMDMNENLKKLTENGIRAKIVKTVPTLAPTWQEVRSGSLLPRLHCRMLKFSIAHRVTASLDC